MARVQLPMISVGPDDQYTSPQIGRAPSMSMAGGMAAPTPQSALGSHLSRLEQTYGLPQGYLAQTRAVESSNGTKLANPNSSARGPYQFIDSTANSMGLSMADRMDEFKSANAAAKLAADNMKYFQSRVGSAPTGADLYGMHQQGPGGYVKLLNGAAPGGDAQNLNGGSGLSAEGFLNKIRSMYNNAKPDLTGDPATRYGAGFGAGQAGSDPAPAATAPAATPDPSKGTFNGGLMGLLQGSDYTGQGSAKDLTGKIGDFVGSDKFRAGMAGIGTLLGGGGAPSVKAPGIQPMSEADSQNTPNMSLLQMLYGKGGVMGGGGVGR